MLGDFTKGFWLSIYRDRLPDGVAPLEMRVMTRERRADTELPNDVPTIQAIRANSCGGCLRPGWRWGSARQRSRCRPKAARSNKCLAISPEVQVGDQPTQLLALRRRRIGERRAHLAGAAPTRAAPALTRLTA